MVAALARMSTGEWVARTNCEPAATPSWIAQQLSCPWNDRADRVRPSGRARRREVTHQREERLAMGAVVQRREHGRQLRPGSSSWRCAWPSRRTSRHAGTSPTRPLSPPSSRCACRSLCVANVSKRRLRLPPSALKPAATASASISVDLPEPLSPTSTVTAPKAGSSSRDGRQIVRVAVSVRRLRSRTERRNGGWWTEPTTATLRVRITHLISPSTGSR